MAKDLAGRYVLINSSAARLLGRPASEIVGRDDAALFPGDQAARSRDADERVRTRGESETAEEHLVVEGRRRTLLLTRSPLRDYDGRIIGVLSSTRDVTEQRQMEDRLSRVHRMESVARLAGGIAHDFNNLLTVVLGSAEILLDDLPRAYARRSDLEEIKTAATQAAQLTRQVLAYSRQQVLAPRPLELDTLVGGMERALRPLVGARIERPERRGAGGSDTARAGGGESRDERAGRDARRRPPGGRHAHRHGRRSVRPRAPAHASGPLCHARGGRHRRGDGR